VYPVALLVLEFGQREKARSNIVVAPGVAERVADTVPGLVLALCDGEKSFRARGVPPTVTWALTKAPLRKHEGPGMISQGPVFQ